MDSLEGMDAQRRGEVQVSRALSEDARREYFRTAQEEGGIGGAIGLADHRLQGDPEAR